MDAFVIPLVVIVVAVALVALILTPVLENGELQRDYNRAMVECIKLGNDPLDCRVALRNGQLP